MSEAGEEKPAGPSYAERIVELAAVAAAEKPKWAKSGKGKITNKVHDRDEEYALVTPSDLQEIADFGWYEHGLTTFGAFLFGGAFWQAIDTVSSQTRFEFTAWLGMYVLTMVFGIALLVVGHGMYRIKQRKIEKHFPAKTP